MESNWWWILILASAATSALNGVADHWSDKGWTKYLRVAVDVLSWVTNRNSPGSVKLPGTLSKEPK